MALRTCLAIGLVSAVHGTLIHSVPSRLPRNGEWRSIDPYSPHALAAAQVCAVVHRACQALPQLLHTPQIVLDTLIEAGETDLYRSLVLEDVFSAGIVVSVSSIAAEHLQNASLISGWGNCELHNCGVELDERRPTYGTICIPSPCVCHEAARWAGARHAG